MKYPLNDFLLDDRVAAVRWFTNGDHPEDKCEVCHYGDGTLFYSEGKVVRYFRHPAKTLGGETFCRACGETMHLHGWIDSGEDGHIVCPGDWVLTLYKDLQLEPVYRPIKDDIFQLLFQTEEDECE